MGKNQKNANGAGTIRKKTVTRAGKDYTYWEARYTAGTDPGTGKPIRRSISGKTQKEVSQKLKEVTAAIDAGTYQAPSKMTVGQWLDIWTAEYLGGLKPRSQDGYKSVVKTHLKPNFGASRLDQLDTHTIQRTYNHLSAALQPGTVQYVHAIFHRALQQAVKIGYLRYNPSDGVELPKKDKAELHPLDENQIAAFLEAIQGHRFESLFKVALFYRYEARRNPGPYMGLCELHRWNHPDKASIVQEESRKAILPSLHQERQRAENHRCPVGAVCLEDRAHATDGMEVEKRRLVG